MPQEIGYDARIMPQAGAPLPLARPETFGAELADTVGRVAQEEHARDVRAYQIQRSQQADQQASEFQRRYAYHKQARDQLILDARVNPTSPDYADHLERIRKFDDDAREGLLAGLTEDAVRRRAETQIDQGITQQLSSEAEFVTGRRVARVVTDAQEVQRIGANRVRRAATGQEWANEMRDWQTYAQGLQGVPPETRDKLEREGYQLYTVAFANHLNDTNPKATIAMIDAGAFDQFLDPQQIDQLRNGAQVEVRSREVAAQRTVAEQERLTRENIQTLLEMQNNGDVIPDAALAEASRQAAALGDTSWAVQIEGIAERNNLTKIWGPDNATPLQRQGRIAVLAEKGDGRSAAENREFKFLQEKQQSFDATSIADPVMIGAKQGTVASLDMSDAGSVTKREQWWRANRNVASDKFFSKAELAPLQTEYAKGGPARLQVLAELDAIGDDFARDAAARQIAPNDANFQHLAQVVPQERAMVARGQEALNANRAMLQPDKNDNTGIAASLLKADRDIDIAFKAMPPQYAEAAKQTAREYYAGRLWASGRSSINDGYSERDYRDAQRVALGGYYRDASSPVGGLVYWSRNDYPVIVPDGYTGSEFQKAIKADLVRQQKEGRGPVDVDRKTPFDLNNAHPVMIRPGVYRWETSAGSVLNAKGERFITFVWGRK